MTYYPPRLRFKIIAELDELLARAEGIPHEEIKIEWYDHSRLVFSYQGRDQYVDPLWFLQVDTITYIAHILIKLGGKG